jgi:hypothetical protein
MAFFARHMCGGIDRSRCLYRHDLGVGLHNSPMIMVLKEIEPTVPPFGGDLCHKILQSRQLLAFGNG